MAPPNRLAMAPHVQKRTHFFGSATTMGMSTTNGGIGKTEPSTTDTASNVAKAYGVTDSASTFKYRRRYQERSLRDSGAAVISDIGGPPYRAHGGHPRTCIGA